MATPTLKELTTQVRQDLAAEGVSQVWIRRTFEAALAVVLAGIVWMFYSWVSSIAKQCNPATATGLFLDAWAAVFGLTRTAASYATGGVFLTGTEGSVQPAASVIVGPDGQIYTTDAEAIVEALGIVEVEVTASVAGSDSNLAAASPMLVSAPGTGITSAALVDFYGLIGGQAGETDDELRTRLLTRIRRPAEIGTAEDYRRWAKEASSSVSRVWVYECGRTGVTAGNTTIMFSVAGAAPIPSGSTVTTVEAYLAAKRASGSTQTVLAPTGQTVPLRIALDASRNTTANQALVTAYVRDLFLAGSPGTTITNLDLRAAISRAGIPYQLQSVNSGLGTADVVPTSLYHLPVLGTITWGTWA